MKALESRVSTVNPEFNLDDRTLTTRCKQQDSSAQEVLYNRFVNAMMRICLRYMKDESEAEDAMITGFVKVFSKIDSFEYRGTGSLEGWVKRVMINECLMALRKRKMEKVDLDKFTNLLPDQTNHDSNLNAEAIFEAVQRLPRGYRTVFNLYAIEGYTHKEIGIKLGINENTSKSQLSKARSSLQKTLLKLGML